VQPFAERLQAGDVLVGDGATGTMLLERVLADGQAPEAAALSHPEVLTELARLYVEAGAEIVETNTFGGSPIKLALSGLTGMVDEVNRAAVRAARAGAGDRAYVAASCGPCGTLLEPHGDTAPAAVYDSFRQQMAVLLEAGVDCVFVETMTDLTEATLAIRAAKDVVADVPVAAMMTFDRTPRGFFTIMGVSVAEAAAGLADAGADAVGSNCGNGIDHMIAVAREFRRHTELPLVIQPNAGLPHATDSGIVYDETPAFMADKGRALLNLGVAVIGGCCGTTPDHIRAIRTMVDELRS
jgi:5-methyltetrahydrofolate--homocysteine methyltransferase